MKDKKINLLSVALIFLALFGGIIIGMIFQQQVFIIGAEEVAEALEGTTFNLEIDLNETILAEKMGEVFNVTEFRNNSQSQEKVQG